MKQSEEFLRTEGDGFYRRNLADSAGIERLAQEDQVINCLQSLAARPGRILEIGCGNGWRLDLLRRSFGSQCSGIDPSAAAVAAGSASYPEVALATGTADRLPYEAGSFDLVVFGFCLYLCDRQDLFRIAGEADRVLAERGLLAILDFSPPFPYRNEYKHRAGLYSFKMDYARMFVWNPAYTTAAQKVFGHGGSSAARPDDRVSVVILRKDSENAFVDSPYAAESPGG